jgi:hypothetical protein
MRPRRRPAALLLTVLALTCARPAFAQAQPPPAPEKEEPTSLRERVMKPDQGGGIHLTEHFAIVFGGIKQGSSIAMGPALSQKFDSGAFVQVKGVYSIRNFKVVQLRYDTQPFWGDRAFMVSRARWQDAPDLPLYRLGPDAPDRRIQWGERKTEFSTRLTVDVRPRVRVGGGWGVERYSTTAEPVGFLDEPALPPVTVPPGLGTKPWFSHAFVSGALDSRDSRDYASTGGLLEAALHAYNDLSDGQEPFQRLEIGAQQLLPTGDRGVLDLSAGTWLSTSAVPFFLMPTLGGGDALRGYSSYRYRDRHALLLRGEYRWPIYEVLDLAGLYEAGKVSPNVKGLTLENMAHSIAAGIRVHVKTTSLFRADVAYGHDGVSFKVGFSAGGS